MNGKNRVLLAIFVFVGGGISSSLAMEQTIQVQKNQSMKPDKFFDMFKEQDNQKLSLRDQQQLRMEAVKQEAKIIDEKSLRSIKVNRAIIHNIATSNDSYLPPVDTSMKSKISFSSDNWTSWLYALEDNDIPSMKSFLKNGADIHVRGKWDNTLLHCAAMNSSPEVVKFLLDSGAKKDINVKDKTQQTPLFVACRDGKYEIVKILLEHGADVNANYVYADTSSKILIEPVQQDILMKTDSIERFMICPSVSHNLYPEAQEGYTPLHAASYNGHSAIVDLLIAHGAKVNAKSNKHVTSLHMAAQQGHHLIVEKLCLKGADAEAETTDTFPKLVHFSGKVTPLILATAFGKTDVVKILAPRSNVNHAVGSFNATPLHFASAEGHSDIAKILIKNGAHLMSSVWGKHTAADVARCYGKKDIAELLTEKINCFRQMARGQTNNSQKCIKIAKNNGTLQKAITIQQKIDIRVDLPLINTHTIKEQKAEFLFEVAYCAPEKNEFTGMYYCGHNGERKPVLANTKSRDGLCMMNNHLFDLDYTGCKKINVQNDVCHSFSKDIEKQFGHQAYVVIDTKDIKSIRDSKKKYDLYITMPGRLNQKKYEDGKWNVIKSKLGVLEYIVEKSLYENKGRCCHRLFRPDSVMGNASFGPESRKKSQKKLNGALTINNKS